MLVFISIHCYFSLFVRTMKTHRPWTVKLKMNARLDHVFYIIILLLLLLLLLLYMLSFFSFGQNHQYLGYICFRVLMMFSSQEDDPVRLAGKCGFSFFIYLLLMVYKFTYIKLMFFPQLSSFFLTLHGKIEPARKFTFCNRSKFYFVLSFVCF